MALARWVGRAIGLDVHRDFCVVAICEEGVVRSAGRVPSTPEGIGTLAQSLLASDRVALEVTGSCWEVARILEPHVQRVVVVSPDAGGIKMAHAYSQTLDAELAIVAKRRKSATEVESMAVIGEIEGKNILLVDDLTETAGTLTSAAAVLKTKGAQQVIACVSHAILNDLGIERLRKSNIDELITTDTVLRPVIDGVKITTLSVASLLGEAIKRINCNSSVTSLFEFKGGRTS